MKEEPGSLSAFLSLAERALVMKGEAPMTIAAIVWLLCLAGFLCCAEGAKVIG